MKKLISIGILSLTASFLQAEDTAEDTRMGQVTYYGSGYVERAPEYGELKVIFSVDCQPSPQAVIEKIYDQTSKKIWNTIVATVAPKNYSETERTYWNDVSGIVAEDPTELIFTGKSSKRIRRNKCTGKEIEMTDVVPFVFKGGQTLGVRTSNLDWLESLEKFISKLPQTDALDEVKIAMLPIKYDITQAARMIMNAEVDNQAAAQATGPGSAFEADKNLLKFNETYFIARREVPSAPSLGEEVGSAVEAGKAPNVLLKVKMRYGFRIDSVNLQSSVSGRVAQNRSQYDQLGQAVAKADFAETSISVSTSCHESKADAEEAIKVPSQKVLEFLTAFQGGEKATETNRFTYGGINSQQYNALEPIETVEVNRLYTVKTNFDRCKNIVVPATGDNDQAQYWASSRVIIVRSSRFDEYPQLLTNLRLLNEANSIFRSAIVNVSQPIAKITEETKKRLAVEARKNASEALLQPRSTFRTEGESLTYGYQNAYLISVTIVPNDEESTRGRFYKSAPTAMMAAPMAPEAALADQAPAEIQIEKRDNQTRPVIKVQKTIAFDLRILTANFIKK